MAVSAAEAAGIALSWLANEEWEPAVTQVEVAGDSWRQYNNNRTFVETGAVSHALAGNLPVLVRKQTGAVSVGGDWRP